MKPLQDLSLPTRRTTVLASAVALLGVALAAGVALAGPGEERRSDQSALAGEARRGSLTVPLDAPVSGVRVIEARVANRPLVVIDPGHGGTDPGAPGVSGAVQEKAITLAIATLVRDRLAAAGRVRVALTREDDRTLELARRAAIARGLGADLFVAIHADSAPNPLARGATVYSLSDVASDPAAAAFARSQNISFAAASSEPDPTVRGLLADLALRDEMSASAGLAQRLLRKAASESVQLRPEPHRFAAFQVLREAQAPAVLVEAGYLSNVDDEAMLRSPEGQRRIADALAAAIEAELATRSTNR